MKRWEAAAAVAPKIEGSLVITCNGMLGRDLHGTGDRPERFYMIGSMGLASSIGMGLAITTPGKRVVVLDGDGNVLMGLGALANVGVAGPENLYHVIFDNGTYASTGGQRTISGEVKLEEIARVCGYKKALRATTVEEIPEAMDDLLADPGPACLLLVVEPGNQAEVDRVSVTPREMATRMRVAATGRRP